MRPARPKRPSRRLLARAAAMYAPVKKSVAATSQNPQQIDLEKAELQQHADSQKS